MKFRLVVPGIIFYLPLTNKYSSKINFIIFSRFVLFIYCFPGREYENNFAKIEIKDTLAFFNFVNNYWNWRTATNRSRPPRFVMVSYYIFATPRSTTIFDRLEMKSVSEPSFGEGSMYRLERTYSR